MDMSFGKALVHPTATLGKDTRVWFGSHIRENVKIGDHSIIGERVYVGPGVHIGHKCKIQNDSQIYDPALIEEGVFIGPGVILTNDVYPRAINHNGDRKTYSDWKPEGVIVRHGASIGAGAVCVAPVEIGEWSLVAAGSIVIDDVLPFALVAGNPAKKIKWVGREGFPLIEVSEKVFRCPKSGELYSENFSGILELK